MWKVMEQKHQLFTNTREGGGLGEGLEVTEETRPHWTGGRTLVKTFDFFNKYLVNNILPKPN